LGKGQEEGRPGWLASLKTGGLPQRSGGAERSSGQGSGQGRDMSKVKCFVCKKFGHYAG
jgi:hypothetical protein